MPTFKDLEAEFAKLYDSAPQKLQIVKSAFGVIQEQLKTLATHGHFFELAEAELKPVVEWPKMFFHQDGRELVLHSAAAAEGLSEGWHDTQAAARAAADTAESAAATNGYVGEPATFVAGPTLASQAGEPSGAMSLTGVKLENLAKPRAPVMLGVDPETQRPAVLGVGGAAPPIAPERPLSAEEIH